MYILKQIILYHILICCHIGHHAIDRSMNLYMHISYSSPIVYLKMFINFISLTYINISTLTESRFLCNLCSMSLTFQCIHHLYNNNVLFLRR